MPRKSGGNKRDINLHSKRDTTRLFPFEMAQSLWLPMLAFTVTSKQLTSTRSVDLVPRFLCAMLSCA